MPVMGHSMVRLGKGQIILGGFNFNKRGYPPYQTKIDSMDCSNRNCTISFLDRELSVPRKNFVAIPIPDKNLGCITEGM
jgi:hypothetical protein